ncbi:MAG: arylsulfatase [Cephaloticoccus sp.]|nr:arylsulfatase [Cephaloticoccus sp.]MCF7761656.1 arylsulfatase [Cephaloticoccus sp.]
MADDLGYGDLGCFGSSKIHTPHLDRLAAEGTRFTQAYAGAAVCAPARCVLMTGLHTGHARIRGNSPEVGGEPERRSDGTEGGRRLSLESGNYTVAEMLQAAGYATGIAGKWGLGEPGSAGTPNRQGFDEWLGYLNQNHADDYYTDHLDDNEGVRPIPENRGGQKAIYSNDLFAEFSTDFIQRHRDHPFFLYLPYTIPHKELAVPDLGDYADRDWPDDAKMYAAMVARLDGYVGRLIAELDALGIADHTLVFFTSDNGPLKGTRAELLRSAGGLRGVKVTLYEGGIRVPMIVRWPGHVSAGRTSDEPWMFADFMATCAELAGVPPPADTDGTSVLPVITGKVETLGDRTLYWEFPRDRLQQALRHGRWKAIRDGRDQPLELYDLQLDPAEQNDLAADHPDLVAQFEREMAAAHTPSPYWPDKPIAP